MSWLRDWFNRRPSLRPARRGVTLRLEALESRDVPSSAPFVAADFPGSGVWLHAGNAAWQQLTTTDATMVNVDDAGNVAAEFPGSGVWLYRNSATPGWLQLTTADASLLTMGGGAPDNKPGDYSSFAGDLVVVADFAASGVWSYEDYGSGGMWKQLTTVDATLLAAVKGSYPVVAAEFQGAGVWFYSGYDWRQLTGVDASSLSIAGPQSNVTAEFPGAGVWEWGGIALLTPGVDSNNYSGKWFQIDDVDAAQLAAAGDLYGPTLIQIQYGPTYYPAPQFHTAIAADFQGTGVWTASYSYGNGQLDYNTNQDGQPTQWVNVTPADASSLATDRYGNVAAEFSGSGLWLYNYSTAAWQQLTTADASVVDMASL